MTMPFCTKQAPLEIKLGRVRVEELKWSAQIPDLTFTEKHLREEVER